MLFFFSHTFLWYWPFKTFTYSFNLCPCSHSLILSRYPDCLLHIEIDATDLIFLTWSHLQLCCLFPHFSKFCFCFKGRGAGPMPLVEKDPPMDILDLTKFCQLWSFTQEWVRSKCVLCVRIPPVSALSGLFSCNLARAGLVLANSKAAVSCDTLYQSGESTSSPILASWGQRS